MFNWAKNEFHYDRLRFYPVLSRTCPVILTCTHSQYCGSWYALTLFHVEYKEQLLPIHFQSCLTPPQSNLNFDSIKSPTFLKRIEISKYSDSILGRFIAVKAAFKKPAGENSFTYFVLMETLLPRWK